jgi:uncharacterized protein YodC (DUF2158 family)
MRMFVTNRTQKTGMYRCRLVFYLKQFSNVMDCTIFAYFGVWLGFQVN